MEGREGRYLGQTNEQTLRLHITAQRFIEFRWSRKAAWLHSLEAEMRFFVSLMALVTFALAGCGGGMDHGGGMGQASGMGSGMDDGTGVPSTIGVSAITYDALYVVNGGASSISVINTSNNEVSGTISLKNALFPHHVNLSPDKMSLVVAVPGADLSAGHDGSGHMMEAPTGAILRLNALTGETKVASRLNAPNHNGIFSVDGKEIWTSQMGISGKVLVLDSSTLAIKQTIAVGEMPMEITLSRDGRYAFVANGGSNSVTVIDAVSKAVVRTIPVGTNPVGAWSGSDGVMYVDNEAAKTLTAINATSLDVVRTYDLGFTPGMAATAPNGELWVTDADHGKVVFYSTTTAAKLGELATGAGAHAIAFSADGKAGYVSNQGAGSVSLIFLGTRSVTKTLAVGAKPNGMVFRSKT